jgi:hypothetical protein
MPNLPDIPGKDLLESTTRRARTLASVAGSGALALGGFVAKKVMSRGEDEERPEPGSTSAPAGAGPLGAVGDGGPPAPEPTPATSPTPRPARPQPKAKPAKPKPADAVKPKGGKPKPPAPKSKAKSAKPAKPKPAAAKSKPSKPAKPRPAKPKAATKPKVDPDEPVATTGTDAPTVPGAEPGDQRGGKDPHHALNNPVVDPDETEYPDPYDKREDPRDPVDPDGAPFGEEPHPQTGAESTSEPPPAQDPEVGDRARPPRREKLDD